MNLWNKGIFYLLQNKVLTIFMLYFIHHACYSQPTEGSADAHFNDGNYEIALKQYLRLLKSDKQSPFFHERIGLCYLNVDDDKILAIPYLEFVDTLAETKKIIHFELGKAYFHAHDFDKAGKYIKEFLAKPDEKTDPDKITEAGNYLRYIENARQLMKAPMDVSFKVLQEEINSKRSEFYPLITPDEKEIIYTTDKKYISDFEVLVRNIYWSKPFFGSWMKAKSIGTRINSDEDETAVGLADDGSWMLIYANTMDYEHDILISRKKKGKFRESVPIPGRVNTMWMEMGATMTADEDTIYYSSDREGGTGGMDIYYSVILPNGEYSEGKNLGAPVNTQHDDNFPKLTDGGKRLYFASKGHNSMGGYDIFYSDRDPVNNMWKQPVNIGYPINTTYDNEMISLTEDGRYGYISAYRSEGLGFRDIYKVVFNDVDAQRIVYTGVVAIGDSINPTQLKDVSNEISMKIFRTGEKTEYGIYQVNKTTGRYAVALPPGNYELIITGDEYREYKQSFEIFEQHYEQKVFTNNIYLKRKL